MSCTDAWYIFELISPCVEHEIICTLLKIPHMGDTISVKRFKISWYLRIEVTLPKNTIFSSPHLSLVTWHASHVMFHVSHFICSINSCKEICTRLELLVWRMILAALYSKSCIRETLNLLMCADSSAVTVKYKSPPFSSPHWSLVPWHVSHVMCHVSQMFHVSHVICYVFCHHHLTPVTNTNSHRPSVC